ncbi:peptide pheromone BlpC (bacteriocin-like peptide) [Streptococcus pneumoniae]|nr:peptide pheromone BlpC (bacteriocin-like peptide) [Streptococcus pneumoniae]
MDKKQNLTSFQELTTTELNQITGGGLWEDLLSPIIHPKSKNHPESLP